MKQKKLIYDCRQYATIRSFGEKKYAREASIVETEENLRNLLKILENVIKNTDQ